MPLKESQHSLGQNITKVLFLYEYTNKYTILVYLPPIHQYCIYPAIKFAKKKKDNGNPIDTSIVVQVRGVA
jgi:hypothetical protein